MTQEFHRVSEYTSTAGAQSVMEDLFSNTLANHSGNSGTSRPPAVVDDIGMSYFNNITKIVERLTAHDGTTGTWVEERDLNKTILYAEDNSFAEVDMSNVDVADVKSLGIAADDMSNVAVADILALGVASSNLTNVLQTITAASTLTISAGSNGILYNLTPASNLTVSEDSVAPALPGSVFALYNNSSTYNISLNVSVDGEASLVMPPKTLAVLECLSTNVFLFKGGNAKPVRLPIATAGGTANALTVSYTPAVVPQANAQIRIVAATANTGAVTVAVNGGTAESVTKQGGVALSANDIKGANHILDLVRNSSNNGWELLNPAVTSGGSVSNFYAEYTALTGVSTSYSIPIDGSVPQNTEGMEILTLAVTCQIGDVVDLQAICFAYGGSNAVSYASVALFVDTNVNAIAYQHLDRSSNFAVVHDFMVKHKFVATATSHTFKLRFGNSSGQQTKYINGFNSGTIGGKTTLSATVFRG